MNRDKENGIGVQDVVLVTLMAVLFLLLALPPTGVKAAPAPTQLPFNVYETKGACVYVAGIDRTGIGIAVIPRTQLPIGGGC